MTNQPAPQKLLTIITSTYNAAKDLPVTAASIRNQTNKNIQWIIADGGSKDGTIQWIKNNLDIIDVWFSEPDEGIYDAWNKALPHAKGEWIQFLGAGDELATPEVIETFLPILNAAHPKHDLVYGKIQYISAKDRSVVREVGCPWEQMIGRWEILRPKLPIHPEVFHHRSLFENGNRFDTRFRIAADSHFLLKSIKIKPPLYHPFPVDKMLVGGMSAQYKNALRVLSEIQKINQDLGIKVPITVFLRDWTTAIVKTLLAKLPKNAMNRLANIIRVLRGRQPF